MVFNHFIWRNALASWLAHGLVVDEIFTRVVSNSFPFHMLLFSKVINVKKLKIIKRKWANRWLNPFGRYNNILTPTCSPTLRNFEPGWVLVKPERKNSTQGVLESKLINGRFVKSLENCDFHYHCSVQSTEAKKWIIVKNRLNSKCGVQVHFSNKHYYYQTCYSEN